MPTISLHLDGNVRARSRRMGNLSVNANVSNGMENSKLGGLVERSEMDQANIPSFEDHTKRGLVFFYRRHNAFKDQHRYNKISSALVKRQGVLFKYYTTTFNTSGNPLFKEDSNRVIDRYFDIPAIPEFRPQTELYARFGIQYTAKVEICIQMEVFLEANYSSLRRACIKPECSPDTHNPVWYQRGTKDFCYHGYTAAQIFPKAGDKVKDEAGNILYNVDSVVDELPDYQYRGRKYWWKLYLDTAMDNSVTVSDDVLNAPDQEGFINNLFGAKSTMSDSTASDTDSTGYAFDVSGTVDELKKDVLFRPPEVDPCVEDVTGDPNYQACGSLLGSW